MKAFQEQVSIAQTNLLEQQKQLENVEYWVKSLYSQMTSEAISGSDSNRVAVLYATNGGVQLMIKLASTPIPGSLQTITTVPTALGRAQQILFPNGAQNRNILFMRLWNYDLKNTDFTFQYVKDTRQTNLIQTLDAIDGDAVIDGKRIHVAFD